jgi:plastocyanin
LNLFSRTGVPHGIDHEEARMRKLTIPALIAIVALLFLPALGGTAAAATIAIGDNFFSPSSKTVSSGAKVRFNWTGRRPHNVTKKRGPGGGFASKTTRSNGVNFAKTFNKRGVYRLVCTIHPSEMRLKLTVK